MKSECHPYIPRHCKVDLMLTVCLRSYFKMFQSKKVDLPLINFRAVCVWRTENLGWPLIETQSLEVFPCHADVMTHIQKIQFFGS